MKAIISDDGRYRYTLERDTGYQPDLLEAQGLHAPKAGRVLLFLMLNPSTADASKDDPTIRRCKGFGLRMGFSRLLVGNLYAFRTSKPVELARAARSGVDVVGPHNNQHLMDLAERADSVICAWGQPGPIALRSHQVAAVMANSPNTKFLYCFGKTKGGYPRHPLMLPNDAQCEVWIP